MFWREGVCVQSTSCVKSRDILRFLKQKPLRYAITIRHGPRTRGPQASG